MTAPFQGHESSDVEITVYSFGNDPVFPTAPGARRLIGRTRTDVDSAVVNVIWSKALGPAAGTFTVQVKSSARTRWLQEVVDDDWIDITFIRNGRRYIHCRGLIDGIREVTTVVNGATVVTWDIRGRDYGKIWQQTQIYFNRLIGENAGGGFSLKTAAIKNLDFFNSVDAAVRTFLIFFLSRIQEGLSAGTAWEVPPGISGQSESRFVTDVLRFIADDFTNRPERRIHKPWVFLDPTSNNLWGWAQQGSDPTFCELYTELVDRNTGRPPEGELLPSEATIGVILRDRPLPFGDSPLSSPWFRLPLVEVTPQDIGSGMDIGRGGEERFNAFFVRGKASNETASRGVDLTAPVLNIEDIRRHGFRRFDAISEYGPVLERTNWREFLTFQRAQIVDWHCLNPYFYNGIIPFGRGVPEIRIGTRLRVRGESGPDEDRTFYVEGLTHSWSMPRGMRTTVRVTRGWIGTDESLAQALVETRRRYATITGDPFKSEVIAGDGSFSQFVEGSLE